MLPVASSSRTVFGRLPRELLASGSRRCLTRPVYHRKAVDEDDDEENGSSSSSRHKSRRPREGRHGPSERNLIASRNGRASHTLPDNLAGTGRSSSQASVGPQPTLPKRTEDPLSLVGDKRARVSYQSGKVPQSHERQAFFRHQEGELEVGDAAQLGIDEESEQLQLQPGQVVEGRRLNDPHLGLILAPIVIKGRQRYVVLRSTGEIWPLGAGDMAYVFPPETIPSRLAEQCWHPDALATWARGEDISTVDTPNVKGQDIAQAQREAMVHLRHLRRKLEDMTSELSSRGGGDAAAVMWDAAAPAGESNEERTFTTAKDGAARLLGRSPEDIDALTAYAAHTALMSRPDLLWADEREMWSSGRFLVRSRAEVARIDQVSKWMSRSSAEGTKIIKDFTARANAMLVAKRNDSQSSPTADDRLRQRPWTEDERKILSVLVTRHYETRLMQRSRSQAVMLRILKEIDEYKDKELNEMLLADFLADIGAMHVNESLSISSGRETVQREMALGGAVKGSDTLYKGDELDTLRTDFTSHKVYVIDDPTAQELDDGISLETMPDGSHWVHVHIADPTKLVPPDHQLAVQASYMGTSLYFADGTVPLLPLPQIMSDLSLGAQSRGQDGAQGVMTFSTKVGADGALLDHDVRLGWIKSPRLISYEAVDQALGFERQPARRPFGVLESAETQTPPTQTLLPPPPSPAELEELRILQSLARKVRQRRFKNGGLEFSRPEASISLHGALAPSQNLFDSANVPLAPLQAVPPVQIGYGVAAPAPAGISANLLVAEMMILAGRVAATWCRERSIPVAFRGQPAPVAMTMLDRPSLTLDALMSRRREGDGMIDMYDVLRANLQISPTVISREPIEHWGTGLPAGEGYLRVTSPLRRYEDLLWHWQMKAWMAGQAGLPWTKGVAERDVLPLARSLDRTTKAARRLGINKNKYWQHRLLLERMTGPILPPGWKRQRSVGQNGQQKDEDVVDLRAPLLARISSLSKDDVAVATTDVMIPELGLTALLPHSPRTKFEIGQEITVKITKIKQWPSSTEVVQVTP